MLTQGDNFVFPAKIADEIPELRHYRILPDYSLLVKGKIEDLITDIRNWERNRFECARKLFARQWELVDFLLDCLENQEAGLIEKSRDMGATWVCCALSVCLWLFKPGISVGWGSRKETLVDKIGDPDSIFEKMRMIIDYLPRWLWPQGFKQQDHLSYMKIINPENGATITGESGDNIGRGGRKAIYFKDESAWYERPERIEAALLSNTNVPIDISSVHGTASVFYRRKQAGEIWNKDKQIKLGITRIFIFDWRDHPAKNQDWYDKYRAKAEKEGLLHLFAQEVDRDSSASVERILIPAKWVKTAIDSHIKLGFNESGLTFAGLDVADEGGDKNAITIRKGSILKHISDWAEGDTTETANRAIEKTITFKVNELQYDSIGVGAGIKGETNRLKKDGSLPEGLTIIPWNAASSPQYPDESIYENEDDDYEETRQITNKDFFANLKAQAWWNLRSRFYKTYQAITKGTKYNSDELISIPSDLENRDELEMELSQPTYSHSNGKIVVNKKPKGTKSPNKGDATVIAFFPIESDYVRPEIW